ncbi:MAG: polysaccharide deacetylase family protein [Bacillota bacterium]|nr:polysaccharide deacetylase family protein [Bacillota bacterium]
MRKNGWILLVILLIFFILKCEHPAVRSVTQLNLHQELNRNNSFLQTPLLSPKKTADSKVYTVQNIQEFQEGSEDAFLKKTMIVKFNLALKNKLQQYQQVKVLPKPQGKEQPKPQIKVQPLAGKPIVYLTFDDGPNHELNQILDILKQKKAKGTFFLIESQIWHYQDAVKRLVREGNYPGLHSVTHNKNKVYSSPANFINEMEQTRKTLLKVTGVDSKLIRAPYGSKPYMTDAFRNIVAQHGMKLWDWNIDTIDWKYQSSNPNQIVVNAINGFGRVNKKGPIIILMHVSKGTASVLPQIIDYFYSRGYQCPAYNPQRPVMMNFWNDTRL